MVHNYHPLPVVLSRKNQGLGRRGEKIVTSVRVLCRGGYHPKIVAAMETSQSYCLTSELSAMIRWASSASS